MTFMYMSPAILALLALPIRSAAFTWNFQSTPQQCSNLTISISGGGGKPPYRVLILPFGPTPLAGNVEARKIVDQPFPDDSTSVSFKLNYPANSQFVAVVSISPRSFAPITLPGPLHSLHAPPELRNREALRIPKIVSQPFHTLLITLHCHLRSAIPRALALAAPASLLRSPRHPTRPASTPPPAYPPNSSSSSSPKIRSCSAYQRACGGTLQT